MATIISLTSTRSRLSVLRYTIISLLEQVKRPDRIVINLSREPYLFDEGISELPEWLININDPSVEVNWVKNTGPYRKLIPTLETVADDDLIVTCDDDVIYGPLWLKLLLESAEQYPNAIVCGRARKPVKNIFGITQSYIHWPIVNSVCEDNILLPIGVAGVVYRKRLLSKKILNSEDYLSVAPKQDDLWFNLAAREAGSNIVVAEGVDSQVFEIRVPESLSATNKSVYFQGWDNFFVALLSRVFSRSRAYMGASMCGNDEAIKKITWFSKSNQQELPARPKRKES